MINKLLCLLNKHSFEIMTRRMRICKHCMECQILEFYSNKSQEWVSIDKH